MFVTLRREAQAASDATGNPQAGQPTTTAQPTTTTLTPGAGTATTPTPSTHIADTDHAETDSQVETLRREAAARRVALRDAEKKLAELTAWKEQQERAAMSDAERRDADLKRSSEVAATLQAKLQEAEATNKRLLTDQAIITTASTLRDGETPLIWHDLGVVLQLVDRAEIDYDDNGNPKGVDKALRALAKAKPFLLRDATAGPSAPQPPNVNVTNPKRSNGAATMTLADLSRMKPHEIAALPAEQVEAAMLAAR